MGSVIGPFWSYAQLEWLWIHQSGPADKAALAAAVAVAESGGGQNSVNVNSDGSTDRGLWQINSVHGALSTFDPYLNVNAAIGISNNGSNWNAWTTYTNGLVHVQSGIAPASGPPSGAGTPSPAGSPLPNVSATTDPITNAIVTASGALAMKQGTDQAATRAHAGYAASKLTWDSFSALHVLDKKGGH